MAYDLLDGMHPRIGTKMFPSRTVIKSSSMIHIYLLLLAVFTQFVFKMPSLTKSSLELPTYPPEYKDLLTELYSMRVPVWNSNRSL